MVLEDDTGKEPQEEPVRVTLPCELFAICITPDDKRLFDLQCCLLRQEGYGRFIPQVVGFVLDIDGVTALVEPGGEINIPWMPNDD